MGLIVRQAREAKKPYNRSLQASLIRRDRKEGWAKRTNHSGHVPSVGHASGQAPCGRRENTLRQTREYSAASTRVLSAKYAGGLRTPHRRETVRTARLCGRRNRQDMPMWKRDGDKRGNRTGQNNIPGICRHNNRNFGDSPEKAADGKQDKPAAIRLQRIRKKGKAARAFPFLRLLVGYVIQVFQRPALALRPKQAG